MEAKVRLLKAFRDSMIRAKHDVLEHTRAGIVADDDHDMLQCTSAGHTEDSEDYDSELENDIHLLVDELPKPVVRMQDIDLSLDIGQDTPNQFHDAHIHCGQQEYHGHKIFLSERSEYFNRMFMSGFKEGCSGEVHLDEDPEAVEFMLRYLYTGRLQLKKGSFMKRKSLLLFCKIYGLADKFLIPHLRREAHWQFWKIMNKLPLSLSTPGAKQPHVKFDIAALSMCIDYVYDNVLDESHKFKNKLIEYVTQRMKLLNVSDDAKDPFRQLVLSPPEFNRALLQKLNILSSIDQKKAEYNRYVWACCGEVAALVPKNRDLLAHVKSSARCTECPSRRRLRMSDSGAVDKFYRIIHDVDDTNSSQNSGRLSKASENSDVVKRYDKWPTYTNAMNNPSYWQY